MHKWIDAEQGKLWTTKEIRLKGINEGNIKHGRQFFFFTGVLLGLQICLCLIIEYSKHTF